jgi:hypothetical protein
MELILQASFELTGSGKNWRRYHSMSHTLSSSNRTLPHESPVPLLIYRIIYLTYNLSTKLFTTGARTFLRICLPVNQKFSCLLWNPNVPRRVHMRPTLNPNLRTKNPVHSVTSYTKSTGRTHRVDTSS